MRRTLPALEGDPLTAADELGREVASLLRTGEDLPVDALLWNLRAQAFRCLGEELRARAADEVALTPRFVDEGFWSDDDWNRLRAWLTRQDAGWDQRTGRYALR